MKSILIIGMGKFGHHLCENLLKYNNEIMIVDINEEKVEDMMTSVTSALVADCRKESVLQSMGVSDFDLCFVCIGENFQSNLEITSLLKELGAKYVVSLARTLMHTKFLLKNGADEVIHPDRDVAQRFAVKFSKDNLFDYIELQEGYSINEIAPLKEWVGKTLVQSNIRARYNISIIAIGDKYGGLNIAPAPDHIIRADEHLMVIGQNKDIEKVLK